MKPLVWFGCACLFLLSTRVSAGQTYQGGVRGQVRDLQGVIPGVEVTLLNEAMNTGRTIVTNEVGEFAFANVLPGSYSIKAALTGFKTEERKGVVVATQQLLVMDFTLQIGEFSEQITVSGESPILERLSPTVATSLDRSFLQALPIFGRNTFFAAVASPNVIASGDPQFVRMQDQSGASSLSLGGGPRRGNGYLLDGVPITDMVNRATFIPSIEAVEDMRVQVKTYDAEMGRAAGGVFNTTAKSGSNDWHGSTVFINKPQWATGNLYFAKVAGLPKPPQYYYDWAGSLGGPVIKSKTFFWASVEGYQQKSTRNNVLTLPTSLERQGDFSQTRDAQGRLVVLYDPLTTRADPNNPGQFVRDPFPGNKIPSNRLNPVALAMLAGMPIPGSGKSFNGNATLLDGPQTQGTVKLDQHWSDRWTTSGTFARQHTKEPGSTFYGEFGTAPGDPAATKNNRLIYFFALNNTLVPNNTTTLAVRYGYNSFDDFGGYYRTPFDAASLGLPASYVNAMSYNTFPRITINGYGAAPILGYQGPSLVTFGSQNASVTLSKFFGHHTTKVGAEYRRMTADALAYGNSAGNFGFTSAFTQGPNTNTASSVAGDAFASFLLGYPATGDIAVAGPGNFLLNYYSGYVQDEFRATSKLTLNLGLRYEFEDGLREQDNHFAVGFDPTAAFPVQVEGLDLKGGLMYAGQNGYPTYQGAPYKGQIAPRGGVAWSVTEKTVIRGGYGFFWAPTQFPGVTEAVMGTRGYTASTSFLSSTDGGLTPSGSLSNPFPAGFAQPQGNSQGLLTGAGGVIDYVDQNAKPGYVQQYSVDYQWELPGSNAVTIGYMGSRSERLSMGGTSDVTVNINQLDPRYLSLGTALQQLVPNPFFGNTTFGNLSRSATIARGQLLRPFPQFTDVLAHRVNEARARYNAVALKWDRRMQNSWAASANYTYSRLMDNQFGESNTFSNRLGSALDNTNLDAEYGYSLLDVPHRLNINGTWQLPFGDGRKWMTGGGVTNALLGGWSVTLSGRYQNGFPLSIWQATNNSGLFGSTQRPNVVPGVDPVTSGSWEDRLGQWLNPAAWSAAAPFTLGNAPRTDPRVRTPGQATTDLNIQKSVRLGNKVVSLRADVLNLFDNPLFTSTVTQFGLASFGQVQQVGGYPRSVQFQARVNW
jgi:hypothetical protein